MDPDEVTIAEVLREANYQQGSMAMAFVITIRCAQWTKD